MGRLREPLSTSAELSARLLRFCLSDLLPYLNIERPPRRPSEAPLPTAWPRMTESHQRSIAGAVRELGSANLKPTLAGTIVPATQYVTVVVVAASLVELCSSLSWYFRPHPLCDATHP